MGDIKKIKCSWKTIRFLVLTVLVMLALFVWRDIAGSAGSAVQEGKFSETEWEAFWEYGGNMLTETLGAYNSGNYENFIKNFSRKRHVITQRAFQVLWKEDYKQKFGNYISREFFEEKSNSVKNFPLLTYKAVFAENDEVGIRCVFTLDDDGEYRIFYLRLDPYRDLFY